MGEEREWVPDWDSSQIVESSVLPLAAEIEIAYLQEERSADVDFYDFGFQEDGGQTERYVRQVLIPMRPVDVQAILEDFIATQEGREPTSDDDEGDDEDEDGVANTRSGSANDRPPIECGDGQIRDRQTGECVPFNP